MMLRSCVQRSLMAAILAVCACASAQVPAHSAATVQTLMLSDIHFDPFHDPTMVPQLVVAQVKEWPKILATPETPAAEQAYQELQKTCKAKGTDTDYALFASSLAAERAQLAAPLFVTVSGDLMAHQFDCRYKTLVPNGTEAQYSAFAAKTVAFVAQQLHATFPHAPVYFALGNNDSGCKDYREDEGSAYLHADAVSLSAAALGQGDILKEFPRLGNYAVRLPRPVRNTELLVMQDIFESKKYATCGGTESAQQGAEQIEWLRKRLAAARAQHEHVWVMAHIPPGIDAFSTVSKGLASAKAGTCAYNHPETFLNSELFADALREYADVIRLVLLGHTHMDEMRVFSSKSGTGAAPGKLVPSISPVDGNNPSFTVATVDRAKALLVDYTVYASSDKKGSSWAQEYTYSRTYGMPDLSGASLSQLISSFRNDPASENPASKSYESFYFVGGAQAADAGSKKNPDALGAVWPVYTCTLANDTASAFSACACPVR